MLTLLNKIETFLARLKWKALFALNKFANNNENPEIPLFKIRKCQNTHSCSRRIYLDWYFDNKVEEKQKYLSKVTIGRNWRAKENFGNGR